MTPRRALALPILLASCVAVLGCDDGGGDDTNAESAAATSEESGDTGDAGDAAGDADTGEGDAGDGDGDGDTGDGDGDTGEPNGDGPSTTACAAIGAATPKVLVAAASAGEAATAAIVPDGATVYTVMLPEGAAGFVQLQIPEWETTQAFFTSAEIDYEVTVDTNTQVAQPRMPAAACPDAGITDQRVFFPHWTPATLEFSADGPREIPLMVIQQ